MKDDLLCVNGKAVSMSGAGMEFDRLLSCNFVYQKMHITGHRPLHAAAHIGIIDTAYKTLYGKPAGITTTLLEKEIAVLMKENRYPVSGNQTTLYLIPPIDTTQPPLRVLSCEKQFIYKGYTMRQSGLRAIIVPYEYPFSPFRTAVSLAAHTYADQYARLKGADVAIAENYAGLLTGAGENPLYAVAGNRIYTTPIDDGAADSVERMLCQEACDKAGVELIEEPLKKGSLDSYEELFAVTPEGIASIGSCGGRLLSHSMAIHIAGYLGA